MAGAIVPLIAALAPEIINLIAGLVHKAAPIAEAQNGPLTGPVKFGDVFVSTMQSLVNAHAAGSIPVLPDAPTVKIIIQAVVSSMQLSGMLGSGSASSGVVDTSPIQKWELTGTIVKL